MDLLSKALQTNNGHSHGAGQKQQVGVGKGKGNTAALIGRWKFHPVQDLRKCRSKSKSEGNRQGQIQWYRKEPRQKGEDGANGNRKQKGNGMQQAKTIVWKKITQSSAKALCMENAKLELKERDVYLCNCCQHLCA